MSFAAVEFAVEGPTAWITLSWPDRLNALNTDRRLDVHCYREVPINSHIARRVCQSNFYRDAEARAGQETLRGIQGGGAIDASMYYSEVAALRDELRAQMRRVASEDEQFQRALVRFVRLKEAVNGAVRSPARTVAAARTAAESPIATIQAR